MAPLTQEMPGAHLMICRAGRKVSPVVDNAPEIWPSAPLGLDDHAPQIEVVLRHQLAGLFDGHALLLAQLSKLLGILLTAGIVLRIDNSSLVDILQSPLLGLLADVLRIADQDNVGQSVLQCTVSSLQRAFLLGLRQHDALLVGLGASNNLL